MLQHRPRLLAAALSGVVAGLLTSAAGLALSLSVLAGWCVAAAAWLTFILPMMLRGGPAALRGHTAALDEGRWAILGATVSAALASLGAVVWALAEAPAPWTFATVVLGLGTILLSWFFVHVLFAVHYAHEHCRNNEGIKFPGNETPDFAEFLYFAFTIGMTFQVSDATTATPSVRRLVVLHGLVSFLFNAVILGAALNLAGSLAR